MTHAQSKLAPTAVPAAEPADQPTPWAKVAELVVALTVLVTVVLIAFGWPAARSSLHDIPLGVAGPLAAVEQVEQGLAQNRPGVFEPRRYADEAAARRGIEQREVYGAVVVGAGGTVTVLTASAASPPIAQVLTQLAQAMGASEAEAGQRVAVQDVVPTPADDPRGAGLAAGALPLVIGGIAAAALFALKVAGWSRRIGGTLAFAVAGGLAMTAVLQFWLGSLAGNFWANSAAIALAIAATAVSILGLAAVLGVAGIAVGAALMVLLGNPLSGLASAPEMLPSGWGTLGQLLPPGAGGTLVRTVAFFPDGPITTPVVVLAAWLVAGLALCLLARVRHARGR